MLQCLMISNFSQVCTTIQIKYNFIFWLLFSIKYLIKYFSSSTEVSLKFLCALLTNNNTLDEIRVKFPILCKSLLTFSYYFPNIWYNLNFCSKFANTECFSLSNGHKSKARHFKQFEFTRIFEMTCFGYVPINKKHWGFSLWIKIVVKLE